MQGYLFSKSTLHPSSRSAPIFRRPTAPRKSRKAERNRLRNVAEYRRIAEEHLERPLRKGEVVHHRNGDFTDNRPENLFVFSSTSAHSLYHHRLNRARRGQGHLFNLRDLLEQNGEYILPVAKGMTIDALVPLDPYIAVFMNF